MSSHVLVASLAWLCAACSLVESLDGYGGPADPTTAGVGASAGSPGSGGSMGGFGPCPDGHLPLVDDFAAPDVDSAAWTEVEFPGAVVEHFEGKLRMTLPGVGGGWVYGGAQSKLAYDVTQCSAFVDAGVLASNGDVDTNFAFGAPIDPESCLNAGLGDMDQCQDAEAFMEFAVNQASLHARVGLLLQTTYVRASQMLSATWWRLREDSDRIHWEVSDNGIDWEPFYDEAWPWPPGTPVKVALGINTWTGLGGQSSFESFNIAP